MFIFHIFNLSVTISKKTVKPEEVLHNEYVKQLKNELDSKRDTYLYMY